MTTDSRFNSVRLLLLAGITFGLVAAYSEVPVPAATCCYDCDGQFSACVGWCNEGPPEQWEACFAVCDGQWQNCIEHCSLDACYGRYCVSQDECPPGMICNGNHCQ
jgi:hypothetical protein